MFEIAQEYMMFSDNIAYTSLFGGKIFSSNGDGASCYSVPFFHCNILGVIETHFLQTNRPRGYKVALCHSSPAPSKRACSCEIAASSFSHSSKTTMQ